MSNELIKYAFVGGELSPKLFGRTDLEQYDLGMALTKNWIVDYRGGLTSRPGQQFCEFVMDDQLETRFFDFRFSPDIANVYLLIFGDNYVRFIQDGAYLVEAAKTITDITGGVVTSAAHGYANGDWIKLEGVVGLTNVNGRTFQVANVTTNTFELLTVPDIAAFVPAGAYTSGGTASRIYTVATPYGSADLENLYIEQRRDLLRITHVDFPIYNLVRTSDTNWTMSVEVTGIPGGTVSGISVSPSTSGSAEALFTVTAILEDGTETLLAAPFLATGMVNYTTTAGYARVNWSAYPGAIYYNVYRSLVGSAAGVVTRGSELGYIGRAYGAQFLDNNIIPDFSKTPPVDNSPFTAGTITYIQVGAGGSGYNQSSTISISDPNGSGFVGFPIVNASGAITAVKIISGGKGYTNPTVSFSVGSGATATVTKTPAEGNSPSISVVFQQRQLYAASFEKPLTVWGSRPGKYSNFTFSDLTLDNDSYEFELDSREVSPIRHMIAMRGGLVLMSQAGIWQLTGGSSGVVTPTNALAEPQTYTGVSKVPPLTVGSDILYAEGKGYSVRLLSYNDYARVYSGEDKSLLSNHLIARNKEIKAWAFAENPYKIVHAVRADGALLNFTIVKEEKVFAWTWATTKGQYKDCRVIQENGVDRLYTVVKRRINGRWTKFIERTVSRDFGHVEDAFCVDCGLSLPATYPAAILNASGTSGLVTFTASAGVFSSGDVGKVLRMGGGKIIVTEYVSSTVIRGNVIRPITAVVFEDPANGVLEQAAGTWTLDAFVTEISGLWHLEGQEVSVLGEGNVLPKQTVTNGMITLPVGVTRAVIGLPYTCIARTLPPVVADAVIEAKRKRTVGVAARVDDTSGLQTGARLEKLYSSKERTNELWGEPTELFSGFRIQMIEPEWDENNQTYFVQANPLPATLLGIVFEIEVGDDSD